jgi:hypothetical protein
MNVEVTIVVLTPPIEKNLDNLKSAASKLTNNIKSISSNEFDRDHWFPLKTRRLQ